MLILIFATTGARRMEVASLKLQNIDLISGSIQFIRTKRNKPRISYIPEITIKYIKKYLKLRNYIADTKNNLLLISRVEKISINASLGVVQTLLSTLLDEATPLIFRVHSKI